eukprot:TRINITY_DN283_c0_g1_i12.p1 TRINITY_DN283_c0_g1~~TRINITY_DN283_c0_g1_i12.p1  ORF type:complete len:396 (-),score=76.97 TRINITY_DN283_c0_g1_i12:94-1218(-)
MSYSQIQAVCERYINRPFDEDDISALRVFLDDLVHQRIKRPVPETIPVPIEKNTGSVVDKTAEIAPLSPVVSRNAPIFRKIEGFVKATADVSVASPTLERTKEALAGPGVKDRLDNWTQVVETEPQPRTSEKVEERLVEVKGTTGVKDRLGTYTRVVSQRESQVVTSTADPTLIGDRLGEEFTKAQVDVKERLKTGWTLVDGQKVDPSLVETRLAEAKGASGVKDRLGAFTRVTETDKVPLATNFVEERLMEVKGAVPVRDRRTVITAAVAETQQLNTAPPERVEERLSEARGAVPVKDRLNILKEVAAETEKIVVAHPEVVRQRLQGIETSNSISQRTQQWVDTGVTESTTQPSRKQPIELPTEEITKDQQGQ